MVDTLLFLFSDGMAWEIKWEHKYLETPWWTLPACSLSLSLSFRLSRTRRRRWDSATTTTRRWGIRCHDAASDCSFLLSLLLTLWTFYSEKNSFLSDRQTYSVPTELPLSAERSHEDGCWLLLKVWNWGRYSLELVSPNSATYLKRNWI